MSAVLGTASLARRRAAARVPLLLVAAHPDDETIGASALLLRTPGCVVVHLTDGAPCDRALWPAGVVGAREDYAALRGAELRAAMAIAGVAPGQLVGLGARDQEATLRLADLTTALAALIRDLRPKRVVTHPYEGGHPDHDAAAFVARAALDAIGRGRRAPPLFEMTSYHAHPALEGQLETFEFLTPSRAPVHTRVLDEVERGAKERMLAEFGSQREIVAWFPRQLERLRRAPRYDFTRPPHAGALWYERMGFPLSGARWRTCAADAQAAIAGEAPRRAREAIEP